MQKLTFSEVNKEKNYHLTFNSVQIYEYSSWDKCRSDFT